MFDTVKLLDALGAIAIPANAKPRTTQFSMARFPPELNRIPVDAPLIPSMVRPRR